MPDAQVHTGDVHPDPSDDRRPPAARAVPGFVAALALVCAACTSPREEIGRQEAQLAAQFRAELAAQAHAPVRALAWPEAVQRMRAGNLALRGLRAEVASAQDRLAQVDRSLLPGASIAGQLTRAVTQLDSVDARGASVALYGFFHVPGLVGWRQQRIAAELELTRARWAVELKERELTLQLREAFIRERLLAQRGRNLSLARLWQDGGPATGAFEGEPAGLARESAEWALHREHDDLQMNVAELLGEGASRWQLLPGTEPALDYGEVPLDLDDSARCGLLVRRLQAVQLAGAELRARGIRLQYWPDLAVSLSSPPLYDTARARPGWSADQLMASFNSSLPLDLQGRIAAQLRAAGRDRELLHETIRRLHQRTIQQFAIARETLALNARRLRLTELRLETLRQAGVPAAPERMSEALKTLLALDEQRTALLLERAQLEGLFWLMDESRWAAADPTRFASR